MRVVNLPKTKKEADNLIDALTQAQYNYNREGEGMSAEDLAVVFGKEKGAELEKNYQESYEQEHGYTQQDVYDDCYQDEMRAKRSE
jgi:hypothetical protein